MKKVAVFCGHGTTTDGGWDTGCTYEYKGKMYTESALMKRVTESCVYYLRQCKLEVITDVPGNKINMVKQVEKSNAEKVDLHVAFHCDYSGSPAGTIPLYTSTEGRKAAVKMNKAVMHYSSLKTRGVKYRNDLYELNCTTAPSVIFECGSIKKDLFTMVREYDAIGFGAAKGICEYLGIEFAPVQMKLLNGCAYYEKKILSNKFKYNGKATYTTFRKAMQGKKQVNCALFVTWALQRAGILPNNRRIWLGNAVNGSGAATLKKKSKVTHPNKLPKNCGLHIGDIVGFQWGKSSDNKVHTMVLLRFHKNRPVWATCGSSDIKAKNLSRMRSSYEKKRIKTLCRLKAK